MVKTNVNEWEFVGVMAKAEHGFTNAGARALFEYFEEYEDDTGEEIEFDPVGFRCEYTEYCDLDDFWGMYNKEDYPDMDTIRDNTMVIEFDEGFIVQEF